MPAHETSVASTQAWRTGMPSEQSSNDSFSISFFAFVFFDQFDFYVCHP
jgi:hypothetical protein